MDYFDEFDDNLGAMPSKAQKLLLGHTGPEGSNFSGGGGGVRNSIYSSTTSPNETDFRPTSSNVFKQAFRSTMGKPFRRSKKTESYASSGTALSLKSPSTPSRDSWGTGNMYTPSTGNSMHASASMWPTYKPNRSSNYSNITPRRSSLIGGNKEDMNTFQEMISSKSTKSLPPKPKRKNTLQDNELTLLEKLTATGAKPLIPPRTRSRHATISTPSSQKSDFTVNGDVPELPQIPSTFRRESKAPSQMNYLEPIDNLNNTHSPTSNLSEMDPFYLQKFAESPAWCDYDESSIITTAESPLQPMTESTTVNNSPITPCPISKDDKFLSTQKSQRKPWERPLCVPPPLELGDLSNLSNEAMTTAMKQPTKAAEVKEQTLPDSPILRDIESPEATLPYLSKSPDLPSAVDPPKSSLLAQRTKRNIYEQFKQKQQQQQQTEVQIAYPTDDVELIRHGDTHLDDFPGSPIDTDSILDSISEAHSALDSERLSSFFPMPPARNNTSQHSLHISNSMSDIYSTVNPAEQVNKEPFSKHKAGSMEQLNNLINDLETSISNTTNQQKSLISKSVSQVSLVSEGGTNNDEHAIEHSRSNSLTILSKKFIQISGIDRPQLVVQGKAKDHTSAGDKDGKSVTPEIAIFKATLQTDSMDGQETLNKSGSYDAKSNNNKMIQKTTKIEMNTVDLNSLLDIPSITETIATPMEEKDLLLETTRKNRQRGSTFSFWGTSPSNKRSSNSFHSRKTSTNSSTPSLSSSTSGGDRRTSFQSATSQKGATSSRSSSEKWQKNRPESIDLENGYPSGSWFSFDSDLDERASHQSSQEHNSKSPKMIPLKSILRSVKSYTAIQPA